MTEYFFRPVADQLLPLVKKEHFATVLSMEVSHGRATVLRIWIPKDPREVLSTNILANVCFWEEIAEADCQHTQPLSGTSFDLRDPQSIEGIISWMANHHLIDG